MTQAFIGLGSNLGDRMDNLAVAIDLISHIPTTHVESVSSAYESEPTATLDQPLFANAVIEVSTDLEPATLLAALKDIEADMGRDLSAMPGSPRPIDLDILLLGDTEMTTDDLVIPHPLLTERDFVVTPLLDIAPDITLPDGTPITEQTAIRGRIVGELGPIRDAGAEHNQPLSEDEWVVVADSSEAEAVVSAPDFHLVYLASVLEEEDIPIAWEPWDPSTVTDPLGVGVVLRLLVPASAEARAREIVASVDSAPVDENELAREALEGSEEPGEGTPDGDPLDTDE